jgi:4-hydroxy-tetrahydrodipicolinate synthase
MRPYEGLLTAMVTPLTPDGRVDEEAAVALGRHLLAHGSHGLVICGTTGESATLEDAEQLSLIATMVSELGDEGAIVAGAGSNNTRHAVELTERAVEAGAHAILSVAPYYNKPSARGIKLHFAEVARAAGGVPVILYNIPSRCVVNMPPELLRELAELEGVEAVKQANSNELQPIDGLAILAGNDDILARNLDMGGAGGICVASHVVGDEMRAMFDEPERRAEIDASLREIYAVLFITNSPAPTKAALRMLGHDVGGTRLPIADCDEDELAAVRAALAAHGLLQEVPAT